MTEITPLAALDLGWSIIPCTHTKAPMLTSWKEFQNRQPTRTEIEKWMEWKPAAWGIVCGAVSRRFVLDFDGAAGRITLESLGLAPHRFTPGGGFHVDIATPEWRVPTWNRTKSGLSEKWPNLDIRGEGGYAIFCGCINGVDYEWLRPPEPEPIKKLPADLIALLNSEPAGNLRLPKTLLKEPPSAVELIERALVKAKEGRNAAGFWLAAQLRDAGFTETTAGSLIEEYRKRCQETNSKGEPEPYTEAEAAASVRQAYGRAARNPSAKPPQPERASLVPVNGHSAESSHLPTDDTPRQRNPFELRPYGVYHIETRKNKATGEIETDETYVSGPLEVIAYARDSNGDSWGKVLRWPDRDGKMHPWIMPIKILMGDGVQFRETLADGGLSIGASPKCKQLLVQYVLSEQPASSMYCIPHVGWFDRTFVMPECTIPAGDEVGYQSPGRGEHFYRTRGTLESWQEYVGMKCTGNSRLVFAVSAAFAGPLMRPLGVGGGGFHFRGTSSTGKSTTQWLAGSVWGGGGRNGFARTWAATKNALESTAELHNDSCLILDEIRLIDPREVEQIVYMLANGVGKARETRTMTGRRTLEWLCMILSSGEIQLSDCAALAGVKIKGGADIRMATIPADAGKSMGIFEDIHDAPDPRIFAESLEKASKENFGTAIRTYLERLVVHWETALDEAAAFINAFIKYELERIPGAAPEIQRALRRFALCAAAGEFATEHSITGWQEGEAERGARSCFRAWLENRGGIESGDSMNAITQIRAILTQQHSRFRPADPPRDKDNNLIFTGPIPNALGYWTRISEELVYLVSQDAFKNELCAGFDHKDVQKQLDKQGLLVVNERPRLTFRDDVTLPSGDPQRIRFVAIRSLILDEEKIFAGTKKPM